MSCNMWGAYCRTSLFGGALMRSKTIIFVGIAFGFILVVLLGTIYFRRPYRYHGSIIDPPIKAPDFKLNDQFEKEYTLSDRSGELALIFFGYTNCPDICPSTLVEFQNIQAGLKDQAEKVTFIFITVDPERDTPEKLRDYIGFFSPDFVALTSTRDRLDQVWRDYGVYQQRQEAGSASGYLVDHSTRMYLVNSAGDLVVTYPFGFDYMHITEDILHMLEKDGMP